MGIEKLTTLAFSMYSNKGAYALLLGSGISRSAHIPSGWKVEEKLIQKIGVSQGVAESEGLFLNQQMRKKSLVGKLLPKHILPLQDWQKRDTFGLS